MSKGKLRQFFINNIVRHSPAKRGIATRLPARQICSDGNGKVGQATKLKTIYVHFIKEPLTAIFTCNKT
jgi:hypothetical protein